MEWWRLLLIIYVAFAVGLVAGYLICREIYQHKIRVVYDQELEEQHRVLMAADKKVVAEIDQLLDVYAVAPEQMKTKLLLLRKHYSLPTKEEHGQAWAEFEQAKEARRKRAGKVE